MPSYMETYRRWMDSPSISDAEWQELEAIREDEKEIEDRFYAPLAFGTAGLRGVMGMGTNRMNIHVIRHATEAFARVILSEGEEAREKGIAICHDCRQNSDVFAREAACVMAANGIHVRLVRSLRPTPELSFAVRYYGTTAGLNITASHNPKEYNGYKVYWSDGAQLPPEHAARIAAIMAETDVFSAPKTMEFDQALERGLISWLDEECDRAYMEKVLSQRIDKDAVAKVADDFSVVYTPFHGCGYEMVPEALRSIGVKKLYPVPEQMVIDGSFPTVKSPNPENPEGFYLAVELAKKVDSDLIIGTDPDSDRVGVLVRRGGEYVPVTGNQMGVLLLDYIISARKRLGTLPQNSAAISTIVTTGMVRAVCEQNAVHYEETFTGFKFMAEKLAEYDRDGSHEYLLAFEESYGYMMGDYVRDKDAVTASMMITEMAAWWHAQGKTLLDAMDSLYEKYGHYAEETLNLFMYGVDGIREMNALMEQLRAEPPREMGGIAVSELADYRSGRITAADGSVRDTHIVGSNVLSFYLADGSRLVVRPSGTEPKIKIYVLAKAGTKEECQAKKTALAAFAAGLQVTSKEE